MSMINKYQVSVNCMPSRLLHADFFFKIENWRPNKLYIYIKSYKSYKNYKSFPNKLNVKYIMRSNVHTINIYKEVAEFCLIKKKIK